MLRPRALTSGSEIPPCQSNSQPILKPAPVSSRSPSELSPQLAARAAEHDRDGSYPFEAIDALKAAGYFAAPVPVELGGLGVSSAHDLVVASSRLARGDASVAIGVNMHLVAVLNMERRRRLRSRPAQSAAPAASPRRWSRSLGRASCWPPRSASAARTSRGRGRSPPAPRRAGGSTAASCSARCRPPPPICTSPSRTPTATARSATPTRWCPPTRPASS